MVMLKVNELYPSLLDWSTLCLTPKATHHSLQPQSGINGTIIAFNGLVAPDHRCLSYIRQQRGGRIPLIT